MKFNNKSIPLWMYIVLIGSIALLLFFSYQVFQKMERQYRAILKVSIFLLDSKSKSKNTLRVFLIEAPNGVKVLINTGNEDRTVLSVTGKHFPFYDQNIGAVILTEVKRKNIGGFPFLNDRYKIGTLILPTNVEAIANKLFSQGTSINKNIDKNLDENYEKNTESLATSSFSLSERRSLDALVSVIKNKKIKIQIARRGGRMMIDPIHNIYIEFIFPDRDFKNLGRQIREGIIVARLVYGETSFIFSDDVSPKIRDYLGLDLNARAKDEKISLNREGFEKNIDTNFVHVTSTVEFYSNGKFLTR